MVIFTVALRAREIYCELALDRYIADFFLNQWDKIGTNLQDISSHNQLNMSDVNLSITFFADPNRYKEKALDRDFADWLYDHSYEVFDISSHKWLEPINS